MTKITYDEVINRIGYFRTKANLSLRETSARLGYNPQFMKTIENKSIELKVKTLLDFCDIVDITPQDFFYLGEHYNKEDKNVLELFNALSADNKQTIIELMKKLK
ncbi:MAG: helix-turn-helix transcriptional regulator [Eubacteriales bacterium]|nr:helix-turn-helix transcriptional regulator [Eubacteriales bacterium]